MRRDTVPAERWTAQEELSGGALRGALSARLERIRRGNIIEVVSDLAEAPAEIAAWCEETGNRLVWSEPPKFWIERGS